MSIHYQVRSAALTGFANEAGEQLDKLLANNALTSGQLADPEQLIDVAQIQALLADAAQLLGKPNLGLRVATHQGIEMLGVLGLLMHQADTLYDAFTAARNHMALHSTGEYWCMSVFADRVSVQRIEHVVSGNEAQQFREMSLAVCFRLARILAGDDIRPLRIEFCHSPVSAPKTYSKYFGCEVLFDKPVDCLIYPKSMFDRPLRQALPDIMHNIDGYLSGMRRDLDENLELRVRSLISQTLGLRQQSLEHIAELLGLHPRTLQRRLEAQQLSFKPLVMDVKMKLASWHLQASAIDITQLADLLGYSQLSAFSRAFSKHHGASPQQWRRRRAATLAPPMS